MMVMKELVQHHGVLMCSNEIIIKMDSDDIMVSDRSLNN